MAIKRRKTTNGIEIIHRRYYAGRPRRIAMLEQARINDAVARQIHQLRAKAGISQRELARRVGTTASVISRLESADYYGHSLSMLKRIALALNKTLEVRFVDRKQTA
jgi:ribosome-binding protein aMBF1 (putative translation factor)